MRRSLLRACGVVVIGVVGSLGTASQVSAQTQTYHSLSVSLFGGIGGSPDVDDADYGNPTMQLNIGVPTELGTSITLRVGRLEVSEGETFGGISDATFDYVTLAGDYTFRDPAFDSSIFLGLGAYRLEGAVGGVATEDTVPGLTFGVGSDFPITRRFSFALELAGHWADFDDQQVFATVMGGFTYRF